MKTQIEIKITWSVDDIRSMGYVCTDKQGMEVLNFVKENYNRNFGINWATIDNSCEAFNLKLK